MALRRIHPQRLQLLDQLLAPLHGERGADADVLERARVVVEAEQQRADDRAALVEAVARHHDIGRPLVLDLEHQPGVRPVRQIERLGDDPVEPRALVLLEPLLRQLDVGGRRAPDGPAVAASASAAASVVRRTASGVSSSGLVAEREQVEGDEARGGLLGEHAAPGSRPDGCAR